MQPMRWKLQKRGLVTFILVLVIYCLLSSRYNKYEIDVIIPNAKPEIVWEYVADFSKMKLLNPTILDFKIVSDHGNHEHWQYNVEYTERLSHWPHYLNKNTATYSVRQLPAEEGGHYSVASEHKTCFFLGLFCIKSRGEFKMSDLNKRDTYCKETVYYQCPLFFGKICHREVEFQRQAIMGNLTRQFKRHSLK